MVQTHYTEPSSDKDVIMGSFMAMSVNEDANTANRKDRIKCLNKGWKTNHRKMQQYLTPKIVVISELFLKEQISKYQREQVIPETEVNQPSNAIKSDLIVID